MASSEIAKPKLITGGCLCGSVRYEATFTDDHDFVSNSGSCQCTQCRKQTGSLFFASVHVPKVQCKFTSTETLKEYSASQGNHRGFCSQCGSFLYWKGGDEPHIELAVGSVDALYLFGQGAGNGNHVPPNGYGALIAGGGGSHSYCSYEIPGVTDNIPFLTKRGTRDALC